MKCDVRYYSRSGNTKKIADAIAQVAGVSAKTIDSPIDEVTDLLFIGGAIYAGNMDKKLNEFANSLMADKVKKVVVFSTAAGPKSLVEQLKSILEPKGIVVSDDYFQCRGRFLLANRNRPNEQDVMAASEFAQKIIGK